MVVDSSALAAILFGEPEAESCAAALAGAPRVLMSAVNALEIGIVAEARKGEVGRAALTELLVEAHVDVVAFDASQAEVALEGWRRYGKGRHPAGLNLGDCAAYALARVTNQRLLFKGDDFPKTDVARAGTGDEP